MLEQIGVIKLLSKFWYQGLLILFGAGVYSIIQSKAAKEQGQPYAFSDFFAAMFVGCFSGTMFALGANSVFSVEGGQLGFVGALGAVLGLGGIKLLSDSFIAGVKAKLNANESDTK